MHRLFPPFLLMCLASCLIFPSARGGSEILASTADAAAAYNIGTAQFSRQRLSDTAINVGGQGGSEGFLQAAVFPFQLPNFGAVAQPFGNAEFIFRLSNKESVSAFNVDLYALPSRTSSGVLPSSASTTNRGDFFMGGFQNGPADDNAAGVVKLQDNILVPSTPTGMVATRYSGSTRLAAHLNAAYDGGNGAGKWVFLRLSTDAVAGGASRYSVSTANNSTPANRPRIRYNFIPEPETLYSRIGTDPTFQQLVDSGVIVPGVSSSPGPVPGSKIDVNNELIEQMTGVTGPIAQPIRIHTQVNSAVLRPNFPNFTRWYQEDGNVQVMRLFQGEQNVRSGIGPTGTPGRIEAFFPAFAVASGTWSVWEATYTIIEPLGSNIFQLFHEGGQLWAFHLRMSATGDITFNRRREIFGLPTNIVIAANMTGRPISFRVRANGANYEVFKKIPGEDPDWVLVTTGSYTQAVDNKISFRWGMYVGSQAGQSVPKDGLLFVSGVTRTTSTAPGLPPPSVTYDWDNNGATAGFGTAGGVWGETTSGSTSQGWSTDATGATLPEDVSTYSPDPVFFGTNTSGRGLGSGTITISDTVACADITFGSQSGNLTLDGGEIFQGGNRSITVDGTGKTHTIRSELSGFGTRTIGGGSTLQLYGPNSFAEPLTIGDNTSSSLRVRFNTVTNLDGGPSSLGAPLTDPNGTIQIGAVSRTSTLEFINASAAQSTNRRIRIGSSSNGSGGATILNGNANPEHTLAFTNPAFNVAATGITNTNRTLTLGGSNPGDNLIHGAIINNIGTTGGKVALAKSGNGTWVLAGNNTYTGPTTVSQGVLQIGTGGTAGTLGGNSNTTIATGAELRIERSTDNFGYSYFGELSGSGAVTIPAGRRFNFRVDQPNSGDLSFTLDGTLGINTTDGVTLVEFGALGGSGIIQRAGTAPASPPPTLLKIGGKNTNSTYSGNITNIAEFAVEKTGTGTLTLEGTYSHGGTTTVAAGTLALGTAANVPNSNSFSIAAGAMLDTSAKATFAMPAAQPFSFGIDPADTGTSGILTARDLDITTAVVTLDLAGTPDDPVYVLATYTSLTGTAFATEPAVPSGYALQYDYQGDKIALVQTAVGGSYDDWAALNGAGPDPDDDFDSDGVPNGIEFFLNAAPGFTALPVPDATGTVAWTNGGNLPASEYGKQFVVQTSGDLLNWTDVPVDELAENSGEPGIPGRLALTLDGPAPRFVRIEVTPE